MKRLTVAVALLIAALLYSIGAFGQTTWPNPSESRSVIQGGEWTIKHIGATVHVTGALTATVGTIQHITSVVHVAGYGTFQANLHGTATVAHVSSVTHIVGVTRFHYSGALRATQVQSCGTTAATVVPTNTDRRDLYVKNIGLPNNPPNAHTVFLGFGSTGHVALTVNNGWALHVAGVMFVQRPEVNPTVIDQVTYSNTEIKLDNYQGPLSCISTGSGSNLSVIEVLR